MCDHARGSCLAIALLLASACGGSPGPLRTIGGTVGGLTGSGLVLQVNGAWDLAVPAGATAFQFTSWQVQGTPYVVTVLTQPSGPTGTCTVANGTGTVGATNVVDVVVTCSTNSYTVGGTIAGLGGSGLVLQLNGQETLPVSANGAFAFPTRIASGAAYTVTVLGQPTAPAQTCTVANGTGSVGSSEVVNVAVTCSTQPLLPPAAPTGLVATATSSASVNLSWTDSSSDETGFKIERSSTSASAAFVEVARTGPGVTSYDDTGLSLSTTYWYRVRAYGAGGDSSYTEVASSTTLHLIVLPKLQYTVRDIPPDGVPDVFVGADPFLDVKPGTEDRAILQFNISSVPADLSNADLDLQVGTLDPGGTTGSIFVYTWEASGFSDLGDFLTGGKTLVQSFIGPNGTADNPYVINLTTPIRNLRQSGRTYIGILFVGTGTDRYRIKTTADALTEAEKPHLDISR